MREAFIVPVLVAILSSGNLANTATKNLVEENEGCCQYDKAFYCCTAEGILIWDVINELEIAVLTLSFSINEPIGANHTQMISPTTSIVEFELTSKNSTHVSASLEVYGIQPLIGYHVMCANEKILIARNIMMYAPTSITLSLTSRNILISWNQTSLCQYTVQVSTIEGYQILKTTINDPVIMLNRRNQSINQLEISSCSFNSTFIIEPCLFDEVNQQFIRNYQVFLNGYWELNCINSSTTFNSTCEYENDTWNPNKCITLASVSSNKYTTATDVITKDVVVPSGTSFLMIILLCSLIPAGAITTFLIILMIVIGVRGYLKRILSKSVNQQRVLDEESNYQQLQNHFNNTARERSGGREKTNGGGSVNQEDNYSKLFHKKASLPPAVEYGTLLTGSGRKKEMDYAEITPCKRDSHVKQTMDIIVDYSKVESSFYEMYKELDLNRLQAILEPVSENFKLFGCLIGIPPLTVNEIAAKSASSSEGLKEVIFLWLDICRKDETLPNFHDLAEKINIMGHKELAEEISQTFSTDQKNVETEDAHTSAVKLLGPDFKSREMESKNHSQFPLSPQTQGDLSDEDEPPPIPPYHPCEEMESIAPIYEVL